MDIILDWNGPLIVEQRLPSSPKELVALRGEGVYLWYREYPNGDLVAYVGKTQNIADRFERWIVALLTLKCRIRRPDGTVFGDYTPVQFFEYMMDLDRSIDVAKSELRLTRFHYAFTTNFTDAEGCLIAGLTNRREGSRIGTGTNRRVIFGQNQPSFDPSTVLRHSFSQLDEAQAQRGTLAYILGVAPSD